MPGRSRSRSPVQNRGREQNPERYRDRGRDSDRHRRDRDRNRSRSRDRRRSYSDSDGEVIEIIDVDPPTQPQAGPAVTAHDFTGPVVDENEMMRQMGFGTFKSTKGKKVENNDKGAVHVVLKRRYRQYMNRRGGFNRPLEYVL